MTLGDWLDQWMAGLRLAPSTVASYRKNVRLHIRRYLSTRPTPGVDDRADNASRCFENCQNCNSARP
jgi:hypothetical protein